MNKLLKKIISVLLLTCMISANISTGITYALSENEISTQTSKTQDANVEFNAYFDGKVHSKTEKINSTAKLYLEIKVGGTGYLEKGVVSFQNTNFTISNNISNKNIQSIDTQNNKILLNKISSGSNEIIEIPVNILNSDEVSADNFSKETRTVFTATYIDKNAKEKNVSKEIVNKLSWDGITENEVNTEIKAELTKYIPYSDSEKYAVIMQTKIRSGIKGSTLPIKETQLNIQVPEIKNTKPTEVNVIANQTSATNGEKDGINFNQENYTYNTQTGIVSIDTKNLANKISWLKNSKDEYLITFVFEGKEIYDYVTENEIETSIKINGNIQVYNEQEKTIKVDEVALPISAKKTVGELIDYSLKNNSSIAKGQIYANYESKNKKETTYNLEYSAIVNSAKLTEGVKFSQGVDSFVTENDSKNSTTVAGNNYAYNKNVKVNQKEFEKILGTEGTIDIYDKEGKKLGTIDKNTSTENENYVLNLEELNNNQLSIVTSKPIFEGKISVAIEKAIKTDIGYTKQQVKNFKKLATKLNDITNEISLTEPESVVSVEVNKTDLTTAIENKNVEIRAILDTSNLNNALYENPTFNIKLPNYIAKFKLNSYDILMANGLKIKSVKPVEENGQVVIKIQLEGKQTEYTIDAQYKGTIVILNTDITTKTLTPSNKNKITAEYTNSNNVANKAKGTVETQLNFVAPSGIITANGISNYSNGADDLLSISNEGTTGIIKAYAEKRTATVSGKIVNNYSNSVKNIEILGRIPVQGNKAIETGRDLGSTFSTKLKGKVELKGVETSKYTVYYSDNANATKDLEDKSNNWNTNITEKTQSYMIVMNDYEMKAGETIEISYDVEIPEKVSYNNNVNELYKVYYTNMSSIGEFVESKTSPIVTLSTGAGPDLSVELKSTADVVREEQIIKMKAIIKNIGSVVANNTKVRVPLPMEKLTTFVEYSVGNGFFEVEDTAKTFDAGTIKLGESKEIYYYIKTKRLSKFEIVTDPDNISHDQYEQMLLPQTITNKVYVSANDLADEIPSNECTFNLQEGSISISMSSDISESTVLKKGTELEYTINIKNISSSGALANTVVTVPLAKGTKFKSAVIKDNWSDENGTSEGVTYDQTNNIVTIKIGSLDIKKVIMLNIEIEEFDGAISIMAKAKADSTEEHYSNITEYKLETAKLKVSELTSTPKYVKETENVTYKVKLTNEGESTIYNIQLTDSLPTEVELVNATYNYAGKEQKVTTTQNGQVVITIAMLQSGQSVEVNLTAKANLLPDKNDKQITNKMTVSAKAFDAVETNSVSNTIEYNENAHKNNNSSNPNKPDNPTESTYKITGTAWLDSNKNGKRDENEELLSNIKVMLKNETTNEIVKDSSTNQEKIAITDNLGKYQFDNIKPGKYLVIFVYDNGKYSITEYKKKDVDEAFNSDAIDISMLIDGVKTIVGISDTIEVKDGNIRDIDIGLYVSEKFDLKLDKYITSITRTTPTSGMETFTYNNGKSTKIEVLKQNLGKSSIIIEYKIVVTNQGGVDGYAKKIVDYLPKGVSFKTELNKDWYLANDGNVYNTSLENTVIKPGESKEIKLTLLKQITEDSIGILNNNAEIYESYNEQGLKDIDSIAGNKQENEDDMSKADVILGVVTGGQIAFYAFVSILVVALLGFGIFEIKKRVINK